MPFDWTNYLTLAEELATKPDEAARRTVISRAYYCVFNLAFARAEISAGLHPKGTPYHEWCWSKYKKTWDTNCRQLGTDGERMKRRRVWADYKSDDTRRIDDEVRLILDEARQFCLDLAALAPGYPSP